MCPDISERVRGVARRSRADGVFVFAKLYFEKRRSRWFFWNSASLLELIFAELLKSKKKMLFRKLVLYAGYFLIAF